MTRLVWIAGRDRIAHASRPGHALTLCGVRPHDPRWAWPESSRCAPCSVLEASPSVVLPTTSGPASRLRPRAFLPPGASTVRLGGAPASPSRPTE